MLNSCMSAASCKCAPGSQSAPRQSLSVLPSCHSLRFPRCYGPFAFIATLHHCLPPGPSHAFPFCCAMLPRISHPHILPLSSLGLGEVSLSPHTGGLQNPAKGLSAYAEKATARCCLPLGGPPRTQVCLFPCLATCVGMGDLQGGLWL